MSEGMPEELALVERRLDVLELLDTAHGKPEIVDALGHSRSTVDRAIRSLVDAGFVEETREGYATTVTGRLATERYRQFLRDQRAILDARGVLSALPHDCDLPATVLTGDGATTTDDPRLFERLGSLLPGAERYTAALPGVEDPRHLRLVRARADRTDLTATLVASGTTIERLREEFPSLAVDLAETAGASVVETAVPPYGLVLVEDDDGATLLVVTYDEGTPAGLVRTSDGPAVEWARRRLRRLRERGEDATEQLRAVDAGDDVAALAAGDRLSPRLRAEGFVRVDERYFQDRTTLDPTTGWRAGLALPEIAAGYAVERRTDDGARLSATLSTRLRDGTDLAIVGPPGSGKSTTAKQVAYRWFEADHGPVFYREGDAGQPFESVETLVATVEAAPGRPLVVVEDAVRPDAGAVFEVLDRLGEGGDASFLLDARESEWHADEDGRADVRPEAFDPGVVETVPMPAFTEDSAREVLSQFESITGRSPGVPAEELLADLEEGASGDAFLFFHLLARYTDPLVDRPTPTTLDEDVDALRETLSGIGEFALSAGVLVDALNAAGLAAGPAAVRALAADRDVEDSTVEATLEALSGRVLFTDEERYRTVHELWSVRFLERLVDDRGEAAADLFGRAVSGLLALADDPGRRERVVAAAPAGDDSVAGVIDDPGGWVGDRVEQLFELGVERAQLAPLFGPTGESALSLPEACPDRLRLSCLRWRGDMYRKRADYDLAEREYERLVERVPPPGEDGDHPRLHVWGLLGLADVAYDRRDVEAAAERSRRALSAAREIDDTETEAYALGRLGSLASFRGDYETAIERLEASKERFEAIGSQDIVASCEADVAMSQWKDGDLDAAEAGFERALAAATEIGYRKAELLARTSLGSIARERDDLETAVDYQTRALGLAREVGDRDTELVVLTNLGNIAARRGDLESAGEYLDQAVELARDGGGPARLAQTLMYRSELQRRRGDLEAAVATAREAVDHVSDLDGPVVEARTRVRLARALLAGGDVAAAAEHAESALDRAGTADFQRGTADAACVLGYVALERDDPGTAVDRFRRSLDDATDIDHLPRIVRARLGLAAADAARGDADAATDRIERVLDRTTDANADPMVLAGIERVVEYAPESVDADARRAWIEAASDRAESAGLDRWTERLRPMRTAHES